MSGLIRKLAGNARFVFAAPLAFAPGHFYSPICEPAHLRRHYRDPWETPRPAELPGIDLRHSAQVTLWQSWGQGGADYFPEAELLASTNPAWRYQPDSASYGVGDAFIYSCMLRSLQPVRLIEVGSGSSSALALDVVDRYFAAPPKCTFIEPYPRLLHSFLKEGDKQAVEIIASVVQDVAPEFFDCLQANDVLFIYSTHIVKTCSDVVFELFEILPRLKPGVVVHFHDVFYPFEYPKDWVLKRNYSWNELYTLRAFLMGNADWEVLFFNDFFVRAEEARVARDAPAILTNPGGGLWLRRR